MSVVRAQRSTARHNRKTPRRASKLRKTPSRRQRCGPRVISCQDRTASDIRYTVPVESIRTPGEPG